MRQKCQTMRGKYDSEISELFPIDFTADECCFMNAVTEINAQLHSVSMSFLTHKTNNRFKRKQDGKDCSMLIMTNMKALFKKTFRIRDFEDHKCFFSKWLLMVEN